MPRLFLSNKHRILPCSEEHKAILAHVRKYITDPEKRQLFDEKGDGRLLFDRDVNRFSNYPPIYSLDSFVLLADNPSTVQNFHIQKRELIKTLSSIPKNYRKHKIPQDNGEIRVVKAPGYLLSNYQRELKTSIFDQMSKLHTSPYAYAYTKGRSFIDNARLHAGARKIMNMDIRHFFDSTMRRHVYDILTKYAPQYNKTVRKLIVDLVTCNGHLVQGACTSPTIANLVLTDFDIKVAEFCKERHITYSRYCDDLVFSGADFDDQELYTYVKRELRHLGYYLNKRKTHIASEGQRHMVTGLICNNNQIRVPQNYKREIYKDVHYVIKYGITDHLRRAKPNGYASVFDDDSSKTETAYYYSLLGRIDYVLSIEPDNQKMHKAKSDLLSIEHQLALDLRIDINKACRSFKRLVTAHPVDRVNGFIYEFSPYTNSFKITLSITRNRAWPLEKFQDAITYIVRNDPTRTGFSLDISDKYSDRLTYSHTIPLSYISTVKGRDYIYARLNELYDIYTRILLWCQDPIPALEHDDYINFATDSWDLPFEVDIELPFGDDWDGPF